MVSIFYGNEPYYISKMMKDIEVGTEISCPEMNRLKTNIINEDTLSFIESYPFLDEKKVVILEVEDLKELEEIKETLLTPPQHCDFIIRAEKVDERTKLFKAFKEAKIIHPCNKVDRNSLRSQLLDFVGDVPITAGAIEELIRLAHYEREEITLYFFLNALADLELLCPKGITENDVISFIPDQEADNVFALSECLNNKDITGIRKQTQLLESCNKTDETIGILSLLHQQHRVAYKLALLGSKKAKEYGISFVKIKSRDREYLKKAMKIIGDTIISLQDGTIRQEDAVLFACIQILAL